MHCVYFRLASDQTEVLLAQSILIKPGQHVVYTCKTLNYTCTQWENVL